MVSGINIGENISTDTVTTSGTIGAALEAASYGVPAIAASLQVVDQGDKFDLHHGTKYSFDVAGQILRRVSSRVMERGLPQGVDILNINVPVGATADTEIVVTRLARKIFKTSVQESFDPRGRPYYWIDGELICCDAPGHRRADRLPGEEDLNYSSDPGLHCQGGCRSGPGSSLASDQIVLNLLSVFRPPRRSLSNRCFHLPSRSPPFALSPLARGSERQNDLSASFRAPLRVVILARVKSKSISQPFSICSRVECPPRTLFGTAPAALSGS